MLSHWGEVHLCLVQKIVLHLLRPWRGAELSHLQRHRPANLQRASTPVWLTFWLADRLVAVLRPVAPGRRVLLGLILGRGPLQLQLANHMQRELLLMMSAKAERRDRRRARAAQLLRNPRLQSQKRQSRVCLLPWWRTSLRLLLIHLLRQHLKQSLHQPSNLPPGLAV